MNVLLWRHAEAEDGPQDLARALTAQGRQQAAAVGAWIRRHHPHAERIISSPAKRARQTADALSLPYAIDDRLAPGGSVEDILEVIGELTNHNETTILIGHQPWVGQLAAHFLTGDAAYFSVRKAAVWWLNYRVRQDLGQWNLRGLVDPDLI
jgi:phosphohistidine phosphatase